MKTKRQRSRCRKFTYWKFGILTLLLGIGPRLQAQPPLSFTYHGEISSADGTTSTDIVGVRFQIYSPNGNCLLYDETNTGIDLGASSGRFSIGIGSGGANQTRTPGSDPNLPLSMVFANSSSFTAHTSCPGGYTPAVNDHRVMKVTIINPSGILDVLSPNEEIRSVPYALTAGNLDGLTRDKVLTLDTSGGSPDLTQAKLEGIFSSSNYQKLTDLIVNSSLYAKNTINGTFNMPSLSIDPSTPNAGEIWFNTSADGGNGQFKYKDNNGNRLLLHSNFPLKFPSADGTSGQVLATDGAGQLTWTTPSGGSGGVTHVTALGGALSATISGSNLDLSLTQAGASANGYLSQTDWITFNNKLSSTLDNGKLLIGDGNNTASAITMSGDASITNAGSVTVQRIQGKVIDSSLNPTASGQVLVWDQSNTKYVSAFLSLADIRSTINPANTMFPADSCSSSQTLTWHVLTDTMNCTPISISYTGVTGLGNAVVLNAGTSPLNLVQLDSFGHLPAVNGSALTSLNASHISSGILDIANGGTGSTTGSIMGTGALKFSAGGTDQNITIMPSGTGKVGIGTTTPTFDLSFAGTSVKSIGVERNSSTIDSGKSMTLLAGGAPSGGFNKSGGDLSLSSGISTGSASSNIIFQVPNPGPTGSTDNSFETKMSITSNSIKTTVPISVDISDMANIYSSSSSTATSPASYSKVSIVNSGNIDSEYSGLEFKVKNAFSENQIAFIGAISSSGPGVYTPSIVIGQQTGSNSYEERMKIDSGGVVSVSGSISANFVTATPTYSIDFSKGNVQSTSLSCGTFNLSNMKDGGSYTLIVTGSTSGTCNFNHPGVTSMRFVPVNGPTIPATRTIYSFLKAGPDIYISWISGF